MMVADTFILSHHADLTLYIIRAGYTEKELLEFAVNSKNTGSIKNVGFVLNNVDLGNLGYGSSYGYGYAQEKPNFLKRSFGLNFGLNTP
jgi:tyrosine-protein kinase Etk/Wzc